mmetsp:Transcript_32285/g.51696  ORF Transcript_32285/g.51696 Transcript_32285/m.51696 type:complete len:376 (+) Transcript_32285:583-1710(+)
MAAPTPPRAYDGSRATARVLALSELWVFIAAYSGIVGAWRLTAVCKAAREGVKEWLRTLPGLVVCGGYTGDGVYTREVWRLDLRELKWNRLPDLTCGRTHHACFAVRKGVVALGGYVVEHTGRKTTAGVESLGHGAVEEKNVFKALPPLSRGPIRECVAVANFESESDQGQVLIIGGRKRNGGRSSPVHTVDLATGACTPQPALLSHHGHLAGCSAARLADGRVICVGMHANINSNTLQGTAQVLEPAEHGSPSKTGWKWRLLPGTIVGRYGSKACVLSDGRFAIFGGTVDGASTSSCEVLTLDGEDERWEELPPMHEARSYTACAAIGGCVIVVSGDVDLKTAEVYEEALGRWRRLPCDLPHAGGLRCMGSAVM